MKDQIDTNESPTARPCLGKREPHHRSASITANGSGQDPRRHATRMFAWEDQVARNPEAKRQATALRVVTVLRREVGRRAPNVAIVDQRWLAEQVGVTTRGVQKAIAWLVRCKHLVVHCRKLQCLPNLYEPIVRTAVRTSSVPEFVHSTNRSSEQSRTPVRTESASSLNYSGKASEWKAIQDVRRHAHRGQYELQLVNRLGLGERGWDILAYLPETELTQLCAKQAMGGVTDREIGQLKLRLFRIEPGGLDQRTAIDVAPIDRVRPWTPPLRATGDRGREMRSLQNWDATPQASAARSEVGRE
jgi:hypothetical protein